MKFLFRADATQISGVGHIFRCLSLARALRDSGAETCFVVLDLPDYLASLLTQDGHTLKYLPEQVRDNPLADAAATLAGESSLTACILDHYHLGTDWEHYVQSQVDVLALDDLGRPHETRWLLDQNYYADPQNRYMNVLATGTQTLFGPKFALLRKEFETARQFAKIRSGGIRSVLVFMGGMDSTNVTGIALKAIERSLPSEVDVTVITGFTHPALSELRLWCEKRRGASLKVQVSDMTQYLLAADLAIAAGGTNTWERCACGLPTIAVCLADNQREVIREGTEAGFLWGFDDVPTVDDLADVLRALNMAPGLLHHMSKQSLTITDARGAKRVAGFLMQQRIQMRHATMNDAKMIYDWRTTPSVLEVSRNTDSFSFEDHRKWLERVLHSQDRLLLIGVLEGQDISVVRFDIESRRAQISIFLAPGISGAGLGQATLAIAEAELKKCRADIDWIDAWVNEDNSPSINMFQHSGYSRRISRFEKEIA